MLDKLFSNVGEKIKKLAKIGLIIGCILSLVLAVVFFFIDPEIGGIAGLILLFAGPILFLIASWLLYGYGEIIDNTAAIQKATQEKIAEENATNDYELPTL